MRAISLPVIAAAITAALVTGASYVLAQDNAQPSCASRQMPTPTAIVAEKRPAEFPPAATAGYGGASRLAPL
jgi:hypothetical protein